jgi:Sec-independent protein translocase protein TatA
VQAIAFKSALGFVVPTSSERRAFISQDQRVRSSETSASGSFEESRLGHLSLRRQRRSVANVQTQGVFGLGPIEIVIILAAGAFLVGPQKLGTMAGNLGSSLGGDIPDDLKKIPAEFKKGVELGEANARSKKAKPMDKVPDDEESDEK